MKLSLARRIELKREARNMEGNLNEFEDDMVQHSMDEDTSDVKDLKEDNDMGENQREHKELSEKEIEKEAFLRMRNLENFPSLSNKNKGKDKEENEELWSFSPVIPVYKNGEIKKYVCTISAYDLATMFGDTIRFIPSIQRGSKVLPSGKEKDNFSTKQVKDIFQAFADNKIFGNTIVLNYSLDNKSELEYNPEEGKISGGNYLQAVDCSHRARAAIKWKSAWLKNPEQYDDPRQFQFSCEVNNVSDNDARQMFSEYNNFSLKVNKTRSSYLDVSSDVNKIVRTIMSESDLKGRIETVSTSIKSSSPSIVTFGVLTNAIKKHYQPQTKAEQRQIEEWLVSYFDELVSIFPKFMANANIEERNELKKQYFTIEPLAFGAFVALSKVLKDDEDWKTKLAKLVKDDFFLRTADRFKPILRNENKVINTTTSAKYFDELVINWCMGE